ncbi:MAG: DNA-protecting protein DprA [Flavobacteriaceae bacterium]|nr:DNA-protecting protein DprA [Flavobacteriaceae bacterium]
MIDHKELTYILALKNSFGPIVCKKLLAYSKLATNIYENTNDFVAKLPKHGDKILSKIKSKQPLELAKRELDLILENNIKALAINQKEYPKLLKNCEDAPTVLFQEGDFDFNKKTISIVGTRNMTSYGKGFCKELIDSIAKYDPIIVSGFAYGVDIFAHRCALENDLQTVAILAHGFKTIYPKIHKKYMKDVLEKGGFMTEYFYDTNPFPINFVARNRIIAGLSKATIVIESAAKGGSLITAEIANSYNRDVFALPGRYLDTYSKGCNNLIMRNKAAILLEPTQLIEQLNWDQDPKPKVIQKQLFLDLKPDQQKTYDILLKEGQHSLDNISIKCKIPTYKMVSILLELELKGVVKPLPGKIFEAF